MSSGEIGTYSGQRREQSNLGTMQRWGGGARKSKRKEFKYSNIKNSCPCEITDESRDPIGGRRHHHMQLLPEHCTREDCAAPLQAGLLCADLLCDASAQSRRLKTLGSADGIPGGLHGQTYTCTLGPHCLSAVLSVMGAPGLWGHSRFRVAQVDRDNHHQTKWLLSLPNMSTLCRLPAASAPKSLL